MTDFISSHEWTPHLTDLNPLHYSVSDTLPELVYEGRREPFANLKDLQNVILDKWFDVDIRQPKSKKKYSGKKLATVAKKKGGPISAHFLTIS